MASEAVRLEILEEAITVLRELWKADFTYTDEHPKTSNTGRGLFSPEPARTANDRPATSKEGSTWRPRSRSRLLDGTSPRPEQPKALVRKASGYHVEARG
jgi:hypothetical protein